MGLTYVELPSKFFFQSPNTRTHTFIMAKYCTLQQRIQAYLLAKQGWKDEDIAEETKLSLRQVS
jgi:hypothetical protein